MFNKLAPIFAVLLLASCGGSSSDNETSPEPPAPIEPPVPVEPPIYKPVDENAKLAIEREDHSLATADELIDFSLAQTQAIDQTKFTIIEQLYDDTDQISWHPTHDSAFFSAYLPEHTFPALSSTHHHNGSPSEVGLVMVGEQRAHRYAAMAANLLAVDVSESTIRFTRSLFAWLVGDQNAKRQLNIVTAHVPSKADSWYFPHNEKIREWLSQNYSDNYTINDENSCDGEELLGCLERQQPDILLISDIDRQAQGYRAIEQAIEYAKAQNIPVLISNYRRGPSEFLAPLYRYMGLSGSNNYWSKHHVIGADVNDMKKSDFTQVNQLLENLRSDSFDNSVLAGCTGNFIYCKTDEFEQAFKTGADWFRESAINLDNAGINPFEHDTWALLKAGVLLADKYRQAIDYPIEFDQASLWQRAMFADWVVNYSRENNLAQPDLGEYVIDKNLVVLNDNANYKRVNTVSERQTISVPYSGQWTTTGWYVQPGQKITLTRHDNNPASLQIKLNYHRSNTNRAFKHQVYRGPLELSQQRLSLTAGDSLSFSSPYGGPLYFNIASNDSELAVDVSAQNVAKHPTVTNFNDDTQIALFEKTLANTELPHVDLKAFGAEQHLRRDRFLGAINEEYPSVKALLKAIQEEHINAVYTLAGFKVDGLALAQSLPKDVQLICGEMSSLPDCLDEQLHIRRNIQHANYDQNAHCGSGCSGNPWDSSGNISPSGWLDNHELGHNLQTNRLNVAYVASENRNNYVDYSSRAGENSNNIFPYFVKWHSHYISHGNSQPLTDGHTNHKDVFNVFMSDALQLTNDNNERVIFDRQCKLMPDGESRYVAPWRSNDYAAYNSYRMSFYIQMALHFDKQNIQGQLLANGFSVYTLLYQHSRIFGKYADSETDWLSMRERLGFSQFPYAEHASYGGKTVSHIPGNDFMVITLSKLANQDWRPYFDMYGLYYSDLANQQIDLANYSTKIPMGLYLLETEMPDRSMTDNMTFLPLNPNDGTTLWRDGSSPKECL
ncbi:hypothetical protein LP316_00610 [Thalassotalea sp. LPB0316]|uniref:ImpA family metalloprotease n=1 Tax=Thalassotalea sp. LPB0316 TaxID=2769490 RepID=UPI0018666745|nr:ImpA family metalloprotease [Thalassotalea sp. LPB0316]QOL25856.1 hypothetical protein LP316_00610 [Thalassotalea sp. LPB0316]